MDRARLIRQSVRCAWFGAIGVVPLIGLGLAAQAVRLGRRICVDVQCPWAMPHPAWLWLLLAGALWPTDLLLGGAADVVLLGLVLFLQVYLLWTTFPPQPARRNPAYWHVFWGVCLGCAGILTSLWAVALLACRLTRFARWQ